MIGLVLPFVVASLLLLLWAFITSKLEYKLPRYFAWSQRMFDKLPQIVAVVVIVVAFYLYMTEPSYYDW